MKTSHIEKITLSRPLPLLQGGKLSAEFWRENPQTVLVFYKQSCQTCLFLLPYVEEFYRRLPAPVDSLLLVSQDDPAETRDFVHRMGLSLPVALDYPEYALSRTLNFQGVPAIFLLDREGKVLQKSEGFIREEFTRLLERWKRANGVDEVVLFENPAEIPAFRPG